MALREHNLYPGTKVSLKMSYIRLLRVTYNLNQASKHLRGRTLETKARKGHFLTPEAEKNVEEGALQPKPRQSQQLSP